METRKEKSTSQSSETIWSKVKIKLQQVYGEEEYSNWIKLLTLHSTKKNKINFNAPTKFMCDWIYSHYGKQIFTTLLLLLFHILVFQMKNYQYIL